MSVPGNPSDSADFVQGISALQTPLKNGSAGTGINAGAVSLLQPRKPHTVPHRRSCMAFLLGISQQFFLSVLPGFGGAEEQILFHV